MNKVRVFRKVYNDYFINPIFGAAKYLVKFDMKTYTRNTNTVI